MFQSAIGIISSHIPILINFLLLLLDFYFQQTEMMLFTETFVYSVSNFLRDSYVSL